MMPGLRWGGNWSLGDDALLPAGSALELAPVMQ